MATTNIIPFADTTTNLYSDAAYQAFSPDGQPLGYQPPSGLHNKVFLQSSIIVTALAEFIANYQANDVLDSDTTTNIASYFLAALRAALGVTPPQFDDSVALATTQFVQRALGNTQRTYPIYADTILMPEDVGAFIVIGSGTTPPLTITLPLSAACITGTIVRMACYAPSVTIITQGGDLINAGGTATSSYAITVGSYITFVWRGTGEWLIAGGNTNNDSQIGWRHSYVVDNGFQIFPIRDPSTGYYYCEGWASGSAIIPSTQFFGTSISVTLPTVFQTVLSITATGGGNAARPLAGAETTCGIISFNPINVSNVTVRAVRISDSNPANLPYLFRVMVKGLVI